ncbi:ImmA/IrrE family metallo-endopeptidase [Pseudolactococcus reticulitermitis]
MMTISKPNFLNAKTVAYKVLEASNVTVFPIPIFDIINQVEQLRVYSYKEMSDLVGISETEVAQKMALSDEGAISTYGKNKILILYNSNVSEKMVERIRFTLAHELGHLFLGHPFATKNSVLSRNSITEIENRVFEIEADFFAKELLAPSFLVSRVDPLSADVVSRKFEISNQSSTYAIENISKSRNNGGWWLNNLNPPAWFSDALQRFNFIDRKNFFGEKARNQSQYLTLERIFKSKYYHFCSNCKSLDINYEHQLNYCAICGSNELEVVTHNNYFQFHETNEQLIEFYVQGDKKEKSMKYKALILDDEGRLTEECPNCKNENLNNNFCSVCGNEIINKCTGLHEENDPFSSIYNVKEKCTGTLKGADRYCCNCGAISTFLENGFLPAWNNISELEELPY